MSGFAKAEYSLLTPVTEAEMSIPFEAKVAVPWTSCETALTLLNVLSNEASLS
jgi:hypothetical protein